MLIAKLLPPPPLGERKKRKVKDKRVRDCIYEKIREGFFQAILKEPMTSVIRVFFLETYSAIPMATLTDESGSMKFAVPTWTAVAPAMRNSSASFALTMPPMPMIGTFATCAACQTMRTAMGLIAGPV